MEPFAPVDIAVGAILGIAVLRGLFLGLVREAFSIASLGAASIAVRLFHADVGRWLGEVSDGRVGPEVGPWLGGALVAVLTIAAVVFAGRLLRRGVRWAGLGWADRAGGALLGAAEGALVVGILLLLAGSLLGPSHPVLHASRSFAALEQLERLAKEPTTDVAAPPPS